MKSILITGLSVVRSEQTEMVYTSDIDEVYGRYSMDAPAMYFLKKLHRDQKCLDSIICLATPETLIPQGEMTQSAYEIYRSTIQHYCNTLSCPVPDIRYVELAFGKSDMNRIIQNIMALLSEDAMIFLDTTGGARNTSYILLLLTRFLAYQGIHLQQAVYGNFQTGNAVHSIEDVTVLYNMFSLINAANTFTAFGNATELLEYFSDTKSTEIREFLHAMVGFSDAVMLCDTRLDQKIQNLKSCFQQMHGYKPQNDAESVLLLLMDTIRQKLFLSDDRSTLPYPELIRWCIENSLIQQAVTIYTEKIPEYLFKEGIIRKTKELSNAAINGFSDEYMLFYSALYNLSSGHSPFHDTLQKWLSDEGHRQLFYTCQTLQEFYRKSGITDFPEPEVQHLLEKFIKLKNCLFNCQTLNAYPEKRRQEKLQTFAQYPEFKKLAKKIPPNTTIDGFIHSVMNERRYGELLQGDSSQKKLSCKPETIRHLEKYLTADCGLAFAEGIRIETIRQFLTITLFIKTSIRNQLNHASDHREESHEDFETFFEEQGYRPEDAVSIKGIREIITKALDLLDEMQNNMQH